MSGVVPPYPHALMTHTEINLLLQRVDSYAVRYVNSETKFLLLVNFSETDRL